MNRRTRCPCAVLALFGAALALPAGAQESVAKKAKTLFVEATEALAEGRADVGRDLLRQSIALYPTVQARYNLGVSLRRTGETTESMATFEGLLSDETLSPTNRAKIQGQLRGTRAELATLVVHVRGVKEATVELDGRVVGVVSQNQPLVVRADPGEHSVVARAGGLSRKAVNLDRGGKAEVVLHVLKWSDVQMQERKKRRKRIAWIATASAIVAGGILTAVVVSQTGGVRATQQGDTPAIVQLQRTPR